MLFLKRLPPPRKGICGWTWLTSRRKRRAFFSMHQSRLPSFSVPPSRRWSKSSRRRGRAQQPLKPSSQEGPGLSPNKAGVLVRPGLRIGDGHRRLVSRLVPLPHLRVGLEGGTGQGEVGETWGRWSRRSVLNNALVRTGVKINTYSPPSGGGALSSASPLQFPCNQHLRHLTEVRWEPRPQSDRTYDDFWYRFIKTALLMVRTRGLLGGFLEPPWSSGYSGLQILGKSDRSLSGPLHATVGRASIAPLALEGHLWACRSLLSV